MQRRGGKIIEKFQGPRLTFHPLRDAADRQEREDLGVDLGDARIPRNPKPQIRHVAFTSISLQAQDLVGFRRSRSIEGEGLLVFESRVSNPVCRLDCPRPPAGRHEEAVRAPMIGDGLPGMRSSP